MKKWINLIPAFFIVCLTYPLVYILNLQDVLNGIFPKITTIAICIVIVGFIAYPFVRGIVFYKKGHSKLSMALLISGMLLPGAAGVAAIVLIEYFGVGKAYINVSST